MNQYSVIATIFSVIGQFGVIYQKTWGLWIWVLSNVVWIYVDLVVHIDYAQLFMYCFYLVMNLYAIVIWRRNAKLRS